MHLPFYAVLKQLLIKDYLPNKENRYDVLRDILNRAICQVLTDDYLSKLQVNLNGHYGKDTVHASEFIDNFFHGMPEKIRDRLQDSLFRPLLLISMSSDLHTMTDFQFEEELLTIATEGFTLNCFCCSRAVPLSLIESKGVIGVSEKTRNYRQYKVQDPCPAKTLLPHVIKMDLPSKRLVIANDLRSLHNPLGQYGVFDKEYMDYMERNGLYGDDTSLLNSRMTSQYYAEKGLVYLEATDMSLTVWKDEKGLALKMGESNDPNAISLGDVPADIWIITAMDYESYLQKIQDQGLTKEEAEARFQPVMVDMGVNHIEITDYLRGTAKLDRENDVLFRIDATLKPELKKTLIP